MEVCRGTDGSSRKLRPNVAVERSQLMEVSESCHLHQQQWKFPCTSGKSFTRISMDVNYFQRSSRPTNFHGSKFTPSKPSHTPMEVGLLPWKLRKLQWSTALAVVEDSVGVNNEKKKKCGHSFRIGITKQNGKSARDVRERRFWAEKRVSHRQQNSFRT